jgi:hypothetical protein
MSNYDNTGKGALWSNKYFEQGGQMPKWTGNIVAHRDIKKGETIPLSVWAGERKNENSPVMRLAVDTYKDAKTLGTAPEAKQEESAPFDDEIPF